MEHSSVCTIKSLCFCVNQLKNTPWSRIVLIKIVTPDIFKYHMKLFSLFVISTSLLLLLTSTYYLLINLLWTTTLVDSVSLPAALLAIQVYTPVN